MLSRSAGGMSVTALLALGGLVGLSVAACAASTGERAGDTGVAQQVATASAGLGHSGSLDPLLGVSAVVEATVLEHRGPRVSLNEVGAYDWEYESEDPDEWTTQDGFPALVVGDLEILRTIGGRENAITAANTLVLIAAEGGQLVLTAPTGWYVDGERYEFWVAPWGDTDFFTSLGFDRDGRPVDGLDLLDSEAVFEEVRAFTGVTRLEALSNLAEELNRELAGHAQGPIMDFVYGISESEVLASPDSYPVFEDEIPDDDQSWVPVEVTLFGLDGDHQYYSVAGSLVLGWSSLNEGGTASVIGYVPAGTELKPVFAGEDGESVAIAGAPSFEVPQSRAVDGEPVRVLVDLAAGSQRVVVDADLAEANDWHRRAAGLEPERETGATVDDG